MCDIIFLALVENAPPDHFRKRSRPQGGGLRLAKKGNRILIGLTCSVCKNRNYTSTKNVINTKEKLTLSKFCKHCKKHTEHTETTKLD
ncbi:50S ribosomal protein L33 [Candidatus Daviesbacteria bacterium]|nr:50S ribosomal protein L33 [Candidatus Daviesbacteria bacterium]